jgi:hypothetical protein
MDPAPAFPVPEKHRVSGVSLTRILTFLMLLCEILMVFFALQNREAGVSAHWPYVCGFLCFFAWVDFLIARYFRSNLIFLVTFEAYLGMALCLAADHLTVPYRGWAVAWCVPFGMIALEAATVLLGWSEGLHMVDYAVYLFVDTILGLLQLIPIQRHTNPQPLPRPHQPGGAPRVPGLHPGLPRAGPSQRDHQVFEFLTGSRTTE